MLNAKNLRHYWNIATIGLACFAGFWVPLRMIHMPINVTWDVIFEAVVMAYVALHYLWIEKREHLSENLKLRKLMAKPSLLLDAVAALPLVSVSVMLWPHTREISDYLLFTKLLLVPKVLIVRTVVDAYDGLHPVVARLIPIGFTMPTVIHFLACGWILLGGGDSEKFMEQGLGLVYIRAVYWVITTLSTVGYGDISPNGVYQMVYANLAMFIGLAFFGFVLSNVASVLARMDAAREDYLASLDQVESFMRQNEIPSSLRLKVREYYRYLWENHWGRDDGTLLQKLPSKLKQDIALHINQEMIEKVPFLKGADANFVKDIVTELKAQTVVPQEELFRQGDPGEAMYFIQRGHIEIVSTEGQILATLQPGSFFGEAALLTSQPRNATARSQDYCDIYVLKKDAFERVLNRYPHFKDYIYDITDKRLREASDRRKGAGDRRNAS